MPKILTARTPQQEKRNREYLRKKQKLLELKKQKQELLSQQSPQESDMTTSGMTSQQISSGMTTSPTIKAEKFSVENKSETVTQLQLPQEPQQQAGSAKKGRPKKDEPKPAQTIQVTSLPPEFLIAMYTMTYDMLALRFGNHWKLTEQQAKFLAVSSQPQMDEWFNLAFQKFPKLGMMVSAIVITSLPKAITTVVNMRKEEAAKTGAPPDKVASSPAVPPSTEPPVELKKESKEVYDAAKNNPSVINSSG